MDSWIGAWRRRIEAPQPAGRRAGRAAARCRRDRRGAAGHDRVRLLRGQAEAGQHDQGAGAARDREERRRPAPEQQQEHREHGEQDEKFKALDQEAAARRRRRGGGRPSRRRTKTPDGPKRRRRQPTPRRPARSPPPSPCWKANWPSRRRTPAEFLKEPRTRAGESRPRSGRLGFW